MFAPGNNYESEGLMSSPGFRRFAISLVTGLIAGLAIAASPEGVYRLLKKYDLGVAPDWMLRLAK